MVPVCPWLTFLPLSLSPLSVAPGDAMFYSELENAFYPRVSLRVILYAVYYATYTQIRNKPILVLPMHMKTLILLGLGNWLSLSQGKIKCSYLRKDASMSCSLFLSFPIIC